jgi:hypothetical protein
MKNTKMEICKKCWGTGVVRVGDGDETWCEDCRGLGFVRVPKTNADRIRDMTDEELCEFLSQYKFCDICEEGCDNCSYNGDCERRLADWLKQPAEGDA